VRLDNSTFEVNDCGSPVASILYHCSFQVFSTFAVLNVVIAIILGAFTWCYSLENSELTSDLPVTADDLRLFRAIWDRFDLSALGKSTSSICSYFSPWFNTTYRRCFVQAHAVSRMRQFIKTTHLLGAAGWI